MNKVPNSLQRAYLCGRALCLLWSGVAFVAETVTPCASALAQAGEKASARTLTFEERVAYQYAIEEVYWRHRIWPKDNPQPKPSLGARVYEREIEKKVEDYLRKSQLVADQRGLPITASELQAEMARMATHTRDHDMLRELFEALRNDAFVIAECLARPALAERFSGDLTVAVGLSPAVGKLFAADTAASTRNRVHITTNANNVGYKLPEIPVVAECADDTWTATTTVNAPEARETRTAVWTGSEMIIWGGGNFNGGLNTGGRYDPALDTWTATSTTNAPEARGSQSAVWTGSELIIWGGASSAGKFLNTGARYSPGSDSWTTASAVNAPEARWEHSAVWTGSEMIVWGGSDSMNYLHTGGRYNHSTDSWTPTGLVNVAPGRVHNTAVWSGSEMIVWGGVDETFNDTNRSEERRVGK